MYIRLVQFSLGTGRRAAAETVADQLIPVIRKQPGCERAEFHIDDETGEYGFIVLFATKKAADDAYHVIFPIFSSAVAAAGVIGTPSVRTLEVYEPK